MNPWPLHVMTYKYEGVVAHVCGNKDFRTGLQLHHGAHCDAPLTSHHYYSLGHGKHRRRCCSYHRIWLDLGDLGSIERRGHLVIPAHPVPSCLLPMATPSAIPPSSSPAASSVRLGQEHSSGSSPVLPLTALHSTSAPILPPSYK